jgi:hypothetical protein
LGEYRGFIGKEIFHAGAKHGPMGTRSMTGTNESRSTAGFIRDSVEMP